MYLLRITVALLARGSARISTRLSMPTHPAKNLTLSRAAANIVNHALILTRVAAANLDLRFAHTPSTPATMSKQQATKLPLQLLRHCCWRGPGLIHARARRRNTVSSLLTSSRTVSFTRVYTRYLFIYYIIVLDCYISFHIFNVTVFCLRRGVSQTTKLVK